MTVSIIIPVYNGWSHTVKCLTSLAATTDWGSGGGSVELVLVDNGSSDDTAQCAAADITIRNWENRGFAHACNQGAKLASGEVLVFLNNDTECRDGWLQPLVDKLIPLTSVEHGNLVGIAAPKLVWPNGLTQHTGISLSYPGGVLTAENRTDEHPAGIVEAVTGACLAIRATVFARLDGFDEAYYNGYEDVDLCLRAKAMGRVCWYEPDSVVMHVGSASGPERWAKVQENIDLLNERWAATYYSGPRLLTRSLPPQ